MKEPQNITSIGFPNTVEDSKKEWYTKQSGHTFEEVQKNGEMAPISWIEVYNKEGKLIAEIKESVCDIYYL